MCTCTGEPACAAKALFHLNTSQPDSCASSCESRHVISSSPSQFSAQMGLCAQQRKDLLVTKRDAKVPQLCVRDSEGFFFNSFLFPLLVHSCVNAVTYSIVNESRVHTGTQSHLCYLQPFQSLFIEHSLLKGSETMLSMLFFCKIAKKKLQEKFAFVIAVWLWNTNSFTFAPTADQQFQECRNKKFKCFKFYIAKWKIKIFFKAPKFYSVAYVDSRRSFAHGHRGAVGFYLTQDGVSDPQYLWCFPPLYPGAHRVCWPKEPRTSWMSGIRRHDSVIWPRVHWGSVYDSLWKLNRLYNNSDYFVPLLSYCLYKWDDQTLLAVCEIIVSRKINSVL